MPDRDLSHDLSHDRGRRRPIRPADAANGPAVPGGRRRHSRLRVRLPARMESRCSDHQVILSDIALWGARVLTDATLARGTEVVLAWSTFEAFGEVVWCSQQQCGISFVEPITAQDLLTTRAINDAARLPDERTLIRQIASQWVQGIRRL
ncbi:PilZ domain-containing protein [Novosphingobium profundi]|uniref:PilZ domain-containing protein n=1 Tax=Novosphingobium profundi TaxID=1774954 RepID=UPI001BD9F364|nr:PilZ domain-containing protein [Novosphingobium profundi]MBT0670866.1 PilZ domain-containing protein [Novosphingobium profundi]